MIARAKIFGLTTSTTLDAALDGGAAFVGLVSFPKSPRHLAPDAAAALADRARGRAKVVVVNPYREPGLDRYWVPSNLESAAFGTRIADEFFQVDTAPFPTFARIAAACMENDAFARAHPLKQPGAPVSVPIFWEELDEGVRSDQFNTATLPRRLRSLKKDPWAEIDRLNERLRGFKVLKSEIEIAPVFHRVPERIRAHASICFMALILYPPSCFHQMCLRSAKVIHSEV